MEKTLIDYANEVKDVYNYFIKDCEYDINLALNFTNFSVSMRNADNMNRNIAANMKIEGELD